MTSSSASSPGAFASTRSTAGSTGCANRSSPRRARSPCMPACPLMHGTGWFTANTALAEGGQIALLESRKYDPVELLDTVERQHVNGLIIVGDPFARPLLAALDAQPGHWDLSSLSMVVSSGAMWSEPMKEGLLAHHPRHAPGGRLQLVGGARHGHVHLGCGQRGGHGDVHAGPGRQGTQGRRRAGRGGIRRDRRPRARRAQPARVLQGRREIRTNVPGGRRRAVLHPGRLRPGRLGRDDPPARARLGLHQLGR